MSRRSPARGRKPQRTAAQTWEAIVALIAPERKSAARAELAKAAGVACTSISAEAIGNAPIVLWDRGRACASTACSTRMRSRAMA